MYDLLEGTRVVEMSMYAFAPSAGAVLADWGADVIKVVHPEFGDPMAGNPVANLPNEDIGVSFMWEICNRGKRCVALDLENPQSREPFEKLIETADVFLTNLLPEARTRLRVEAGDIHQIKPALVYARASGHGSRGPEKSTGGYDHTDYWTRSGMAYAVSVAGGEFIPQPGPALGDLTAGTTLAGAIASALVRKERTGRGAIVDVSLLSTGMFMFSPSVVASALYGVPTIPRFAHSDTPNPLVAGYETSDGRMICFAGMRTDSHWSDLCDSIGRSDLANDPRFADGPRRLANNRECIAVLDEIFKSRTLAQWVSALEGISTPWTVLQSAEEAREDAQVVANNYMVTIQSEAGTDCPLVMSPAQFDDIAPGLQRAPGHGEHTDEILMELGFDWDQIIEMKVAGAVM